MDRDAEHLKLLSIFYYIRGGICAFFSCFFAIYILMGMVFAVGAAASHGHNGAPPAAVGILFAVIGCFAIIFGWIWSALVIYAGRCLAQRKHRVYCMVIAGISCVLVPYGTILGVLTLIVLGRPSVQQMFDQPPATVPR